MTDPKNWKILTHPFSSEIDDSLKQQHHAAQFIALVGKYLIPQLPDDSNTNMVYSPEYNLLIGNKLSKRMHIALHLPDIILHVLDKDYKSKYSIPLNGKTKNKVFEELKLSLEKFGTDVSQFTKELHYEMPLHDLDKDLPFSIINKDSFQINTVYRDNAEIILKNIAREFTHASSVRVWPHHFDTGSYIPVEFNTNNEVVKSVGIGWAIPDNMVNEPYYYLSFWSENPVQNFNKLPSPDSGKWMTDWKGGVLKLSDIIKEKTSVSQYEQVKLFFKSGIEILTKQYL
jgi:hypothetical protein